MNLRNLTAGLAIWGLAAATEGDQSPKTTEKNSPGENLPGISAVVDGTKEDLGGIENVDDPQTAEEVLAIIKAGSSSSIADLAERDPEMHALLLPNPELKLMTMEGLLEPVWHILVFLYRQMSITDIIFLAAMLWIFGARKVGKGAWKLGGHGVRLITAEKKPEELGKPIAKTKIPTINKILAELDDVGANAMSGLRPESRQRLSEHFEFLKERLDAVNFLDEAHGLEAFKLLLQSYYIDLRIKEINLNLPVTPNPELETELENLTNVQAEILNKIAHHQFNVSSLRKGSEKMVAQFIKGEIRRAMESLDRDEPSKRYAEGQAQDLVSIPRIYDIDTKLRAIKVMEAKLALWKERAHQAAQESDPGDAAPVVATQRWEAAQAFERIYKELETDLASAKSELGKLGKIKGGVKSIMPTSNKPRSALRATGLAAALTGGYYGLKELSALLAYLNTVIAEPVIPPAPPKPDVVEEAKKTDQAERDAEAKRKAEEAWKRAQEARKQKPQPSPSSPPTPKPGKLPSGTNTQPGGTIIEQGQTDVDKMF